VDLSLSAAMRQSRSGRNGRTDALRNRRHAQTTGNKIPIIAAGTMAHAPRRPLG
jgi:hypothetical protein